MTIRRILLPANNSGLSFAPGRCINICMYRGTLALLLLTLSLTGCGKSSSEKTPEIGLKINYVEQGAEVVVGDDVRAAHPGDPVPSNATVRAKGGVVDVGLDEGRAVRLLGGGEAAVSTGKGAEGEREVEFKLDMGTLVANLKSARVGPIVFRVSTPAGVCGARGTAFFVKNNPGGEMVVGVDNGQVHLKGAAGGEVDIPAGHKAVSTLTAPVADIDNLVETEREILSQASLMNFDVVLAATRTIIAAADVKAIESGLETYRAMNGAYPEDLRDAMEGVKDPWGRGFNYIPNADRTDYQLSSSGPDGQVNTADDIRLK